MRVFGAFYWQMSFSTMTYFDQDRVTSIFTFESSAQGSFDKQSAFLKRKEYRNGGGGAIVGLRWGAFLFLI